MMVPPLSRCYFAVGFASLSLAFASLGVAPRAAGGFFYHARLVGIVHLVTLGWITCVILGCLYAVVPTRLNRPWPVWWGDYGAFASIVIGLIGMVAHFWIEEHGGMAWSGLMVLAGIGYVVISAGPRVYRATGPGKLPLLLGMTNILIAAFAGVLLGFDKVHHFLPGYVISNVLAHAHLASLGWASMMCLGLASIVGPRVHQAGARWPIAVLQVASLGVFVSLLTRSAAATVFSLVAAVTLGIAAVRTCAITRDVAGQHTAAALGFLACAALTGVALATLPSSDFTMRLALAYGTAGLLGFLAQTLLVVLIRLEPEIVVNRVTCSLWSGGVVMIGAGLFLGMDRLVGGGAWMAVAATLLPVVPPLAALLARPLSWRHAADPRRSPEDELTLSQGRS